jgi:hypothetical protein
MIIMAWSNRPLYLHAMSMDICTSIFSDVIVRDPHDFSVLPNGHSGIIQVISLLPESYPGHALLTEDEGVILGEDDCDCGRKGKYMRILGRLKKAELRGVAIRMQHNLSGLDFILGMKHSCTVCLSKKRYHFLPRILSSFWTLFPASR